MAGDWRISADERIKYDSYFQQCSPTQGYVTGEQARNFFVKSGLPGDILRKIWDLSDITADGRLDKREFFIACHLISSQVQKKCPLPPNLPPTLLSDAIIITTNGLPPAPPPMPILPLSITRKLFNFLSEIKKKHCSEFIPIKGPVNFWSGKIDILVFNAFVNLSLK
jgi:hypothetical protein